MDNYLKPRRGKKATAERVLVGNNRLKKGEVFFEANDNGVGKGPGKIKLGDGVSDYGDLPYFIDPSKMKFGRTIKAYTEINANDSHYYLEGALYLPAGAYTINMQFDTNFGYINGGRFIVGFFDTNGKWYDMGSVFPSKAAFWKRYSLVKTFGMSEDTIIYPAIRTVNSTAIIKDGVDPNTGKIVNPILNNYAPIYKLSKGGIYICGGLPIYDAMNGTDSHYILRTDGLFYKCDKDGNIIDTTGVSSIDTTIFSQNRTIEITDSYQLYIGDSRITFKLVARKENRYDQKYGDSTSEGKDEWGYYYVEDPSTGENIEGSMPKIDE